MPLRTTFASDNEAKVVRLQTVTEFINCFGRSVLVILEQILLNSCFDPWSERERVKRAAFAPARAIKRFAAAANRVWILLASFVHRGRFKMLLRTNVHANTGAVAKVEAASPGQCFDEFAATKLP